MQSSSDTTRRRTPAAKEIKAAQPAVESVELVEKTDWVKYSFFFFVFFLFLTLVFCSIIFTLLRLTYSAGGALDVLQVHFKPQIDAFMAKVEEFEGAVRAAQKR